MDIDALWFQPDSHLSFFHLLFVSVLHEVEEDTVEFSWKRNRLFNHTACLVLYQICMEVQYVEFGGACFIVATLLYMHILFFFFYHNTAERAAFKILWK